MSAAATDESTGTALVAVSSHELRRQLIDFLAAQGYACVPAPGVGAALQVARDCTDLEIVIGHVPLSEAASAAAAITARRPGVRMLFLCSEPEFVATELVRHPRLAFLETPFAWSDLKRVLSRLQADSWLAFAGTRIDQPVEPRPAALAGAQL